MSLFQVGDAVQVLMPGEDIDGLTGEVVEVLDKVDALWPIKVKFYAPGFGSLNWVFFEDELEKIDD